jgi:hypothetical protein
MSLQIDPKMQIGLVPELYERLITGNPPRIGEGGLVFTGAVRLSWPSLDKPTVMKGQEGKATPKYQASGLFTHKNVGVIMEALKAAVRLHYPAVSDPSVMLNPRDKNHPMKDQGLKINVSDGGFEPVKATVGGYVLGFPFVTAKSTKAVPCFHNVGGRVVAVLPEELTKVLYAGCWVTMKLAIIKSTSPGNPGVFFGLQSIMKLADDTAFGGGGGGGTAEDFEGTVAIEDPNANTIMQNASLAQNDWDEGPKTAAASGDDWG